MVRVSSPCVFPSACVCVCVQTDVLTVSSPPPPAVWLKSPSPLTCRCASCRTSLRRGLRAAPSRTRMTARSPRGSPVCRSQTLTTATITTTTTTQVTCDAGALHQAAQTNRTMIPGPPPPSHVWVRRLQPLSLPAPCFNHLPPLQPLDLTEVAAPTDRCPPLKDTLLTFFPPGKEEDNVLMHCYWC